ncbi:MAG TPA: dihydrofolate reductase [Gammaproteobacteria bacterium]|nr:dihydrofolate reductase [Gammaproteobacteria bacterium]
MSIQLIVAMSENRVIGKDNKLPWHLPNDLKHFKNLTLGKAVLMGRKTFESIGKLLPDRTNIVLTTDPAYVISSGIVVNSIEEALAIGETFPELMVIGGETLFRQCISIADTMHLTLVHTTIDGDTFFPAFDQNIWQEVERIDMPKDEKHVFAYSFLTLKNTEFLTTSE